MSGKRKREGSPPREAPGPTGLRLLPERAFVLQLDVRAHPPRHVLGRIAHVTSGRTARITSLRGLLTFLTDVLRDATGSGVRS